MALNLDLRAQALLHMVQAQTGTLSKATEQAIQQAAAQTTLTATELQQVLLQAMPEQKGAIDQSAQRCLSYHSDGKNPTFLTQILDLRIEKEEAKPWRNPEPVPRGKDPLFAQISMAKNASYVLMFNARNVDENGRPLLMKVIARDNVDPKSLDLSQYRTLPNTPPDIVTVAANAEFIDIQDTDEAEFAFGDPLRIVSLGAKAEELSAQTRIQPKNKLTTSFFSGGRVVQVENRVGNELDATPVAVFPQKITSSMKLDSALSLVNWLDADFAPTQITGTIDVGRGLIFEPGANANVRLFVSPFPSVRVGVAATDAQMLGSEPATLDVVNYAGTPRALAQLPLEIQTLDGNRPANDATSFNFATSQRMPLSQFIYAAADKIAFGGKPVTPMADRPQTMAELAANGISVVKEPLGDAAQKGQKLQIQLPAGLLTNAEGCTLQVGYRQNGKWMEAGSQAVGKGGASAAATLSVEVPDAVAMHQSGEKLEIRVIMPNGFPAERMLVEYKDIPWS